MPIYVGIEGKARKIKVGYAGDSYGNAQVIYKAGIVPSGYIPVEYIYNDTSACNYINTGITANTYTRIICKISFGPNADSYTRRIIGGEYIQINKNNSYSSSDNLVIAVDNSYTAISLRATPQIIDINRDANKGTYVNDVLKFTNTSSFNNTAPTLLFDQERIRDARIYSCAIYQSMLNGILSRNYIPCIRISDGRVGMWESVQGKFEAGSSSEYHYSNGPVITS